MSSEISMLILCVVIVAIGGIYQILCWLIARRFRPRCIVCRLQRSAAKAAREAEAEAVAEQQSFDQIIAAEYPAIPTQRQPKKGQP